MAARILEAMNYITVLYKEEDHCLCIFSLAPQYDNVRVTAATVPGLHILILSDIN